MINIRNWHKILGPHLVGMAVGAFVVTLVYLAFYRNNPVHETAVVPFNPSTYRSFDSENYFGLMRVAAARALIRDTEIKALYEPSSFCSVYQQQAALGLQFRWQNDVLFGLYGSQSNENYRTLRSIAEVDATNVDVGCSIAEAPGAPFDVIMVSSPEVRAALKSAGIAHSGVATTNTALWK